MSWMNRKSNINISQLFIDALCLFLTYTVTIFMTGKIFRPVSLGEYLWVPVLFGMVYLFTMFICEMYHRSTFTYQDRTLRYVLKACILAAVFCLVMMPFAFQNDFGIDFLMLYLLIALVIISIQYITMQELRLAHNSRWNKHAVFVGCRENIQEYLYYIKKTSFQVDVVGYVTLDDSHSISEKNLGDINNLGAILKDNIVDEVIFALPCGRIEEIRPYVLLCKEKGLTVKLAMDFFENHDSKSSVHTVGTIPVFTWQTTALNDFQNLAKRCMDILGALIGLCFFFITSILIIPLIKLQIRGPIFIRRVYLSLNGRPFTLFWYRTSSDQTASQSGSPIPKTIIGKILRRTAMDHLPIFWSVLRGDMSLVGSLPIPSTSVDGLSGGNKLRNICIKPGLTGAWRFINGNETVDEAYIANLNAQYTHKWSLLRDAWLLTKTIIVILVTNSDSGMTLFTKLEGQHSH